jgi:hypothetical protein
MVLICFLLSVFFLKIYSCDGICQRAFHLGASLQVDSEDDSEEHDDCREKLGLTLDEAKVSPV